MVSPVTNNLKPLFGKNGVPKHLMQTTIEGESFYINFASRVGHSWFLYVRNEAPKRSDYRDERGDSRKSTEIERAMRRACKSLLVRRCDRQGNTLSLSVRMGEDKHDIQVLISSPQHAQASHTAAAPAE